ncbi:MAG: hypothetical protein KGI27_12915 [Thaumarchaeota archaeon]|nr:hypothetical protein [Nitrososphaerota archaeon]
MKDLIKKRRKKTNAQKLEAKKEKKTKERLRERAGNECERCGKSGKGLQWCHIAGRSAPLKHDLKNIFLLCSGCHLWFDNSSNRLEAIDWLLANRTIAELNMLQLKKQL